MSTQTFDSFKNDFFYLHLFPLKNFFLPQSRIITLKSTELDIS